MFWYLVIGLIISIYLYKKHGNDKEIRDIPWGYWIIAGLLWPGIVVLWIIELLKE